MIDKVSDNFSWDESFNDSVLNHGLIFIPDISGFTRFVHETEVFTGRRIIYELLSAIISENKLRLNISEIEGDAILFYRYGTPPSTFEVLQQYCSMLAAFREKLEQINQKNGIEYNLSLKLVAHYGPMTEYDISGFKKLYGNAVVEAHVLLKNDIASHSYALLTQQLTSFSESVNLALLPIGVKSQTLCNINGDIQNIAYTYYDFGSIAIIV